MSIADTAVPRLISLDQAPPDAEVGELLVAVSVYATNVVKDLHQNIKNLVGGRMNHYETLIESALEKALTKLQTKALERGYDGVIGVKIAHPQVVDGGVEIIVYGNGFYRAGRQPAAGAVS